MSQKNNEQTYKLKLFTIEVYSKQTGMVSMSAFRETLPASLDTDSLLESTLAVVLTFDDSN